MPGELRLTPTWHAVGIEIPFSGDANCNSEGRVYWRKSPDGAWRNGIDLTFNHKLGLAWSSVYPLEPGDSIILKVEFRDPAHDSKGVLEGTAATLRMNLQPSGGRTYYVSPNGRDTNRGGRRKPFRTLAAAADSARPGDIVVVRGGVYREGSLFAGIAGSPDAPIVFRAADGERPVLDSSIELPKDHHGWRHHEGQIYAAQLPFDWPEVASVAGDGLGYGYVAQDGKRMFYYKSLAALVDDSLNAPRAFYCDTTARVLYVRTGLVDQPWRHAYRIAGGRYGILFEGSRYVIVQGFEIAYYGEAAVAFKRGATGNVLIDCELHNVPWGVLLKDVETSGNAVWRCTIREPGLTEIPWSSVKASGYPRQGIMCSYAGWGNSFCYNEIDGFFDGIVPLSWKRPDDLRLHRDTDIMYNVIYNLGDDALELDGGGVNMRVHGNVIRNALTAVSLAPIERGPVYVTRNEATYMSMMFKLNVGGCTSYGPAYVWHNSGYGLNSGNGIAMIGLTAEQYSGVPCTNKHFANNAIIGNVRAVRNGADGNFLDYNAYWLVDGSRQGSFQWEGELYRSIDQFAASTGQETHGVYANPLFSSTPGLGQIPWKGYLDDQIGNYPLQNDPHDGDFSLQPGSPLIDAGVLIRGVNDNYSSGAPDIGALEFERDN